VSTIRQGARALQAAAAKSRCGALGEAADEASKVPRKLAGGNMFPIGSMYAIYGNIYHQYTPNVSLYLYHTWILWVCPMVFSNVAGKSSIMVRVYISEKMIYKYLMDFQLPGLMGKITY
jgi:hypothetical protein